MRTKNKIYTISASFFIAGLALTAFLIYPTIRDIKDISAKIKMIKNESFLVGLQSEKTSDFKKRREEHEATLKEINQSFVDMSNPVEFIKFLEDSARASNVSADINLTYPSGSNLENSPEKVVFQVYAEGNFLSILEFSEKIETNSYAISIKDLTLDKLKRQAEENNDNGKIKANFTIEAIVAPLIKDFSAVI